MSKNKRSIKSLRQEINKQINDTKNIPNVDLKRTNGFNFYSVYNWLGSTDRFYSKNDFTNMLDSSDEFARKVYNIVNVMVPILYNDCDEIFIFSGYRRYKHCHQVEDKHKELVKEIAQDINSVKLPNFDDENDFSWWQIAFSGPVRIYGVYSKEDNSFFPLFVDWHHLINPSSKYNGKDYGHYSYDPSKYD